MAKLSVPKFVKEYAFVSVAAYLVSLALYGRKNVVATYKALEKGTSQYMAIDATGERETSVAVGGAVAGDFTASYGGGTSGNSETNK